MIRANIFFGEILRFQFVCSVISYCYNLILNISLTMSVLQVAEYLGLQVETALRLSFKTGANKETGIVTATLL